ncbi:MAG: hypothetical protein EBZ77_07260 [Chitinophagia bacterium]|nr:hypothetical protein [Chitinophagia bacterium]
MNRTFLLLIFIFMFFTLSVSGQGSISRLSVYAGGGAAYYMGDLQPLAFPTIKGLGLSGQAGLGYQLYRRFGVSLHYQFNHLRGDDALSNDIKRRNRFLSFHSDVHEVSLRLTYDLLRSDKFKSIPYLIAGFGYFHFNPLASDNTALQPLGTEGQYVGSNAYPQPYSLWTPSIPFGLGFRYRISCRFSIKAEVVYHKTFTDYLDDVSTTYVGADKFSSKPKNATARALQDRSVELNASEPLGRAGKQRGNTSSFDQYLIANVSLSFHFTTYRCPQYLNETLIRKR